MANLKDRACKFHCVIELNGLDLLEKEDRPLNIKDFERKFCDSACFDFYYIIHDKDTLENGELKRPHLHLILDFQKHRSIESVITTLSSALNISSNRIGVIAIMDMASMVRYLTHEDNEDKYKYDPKEVHTNNQILYERFVSGTKLDFNYLLQCLQKLDYRYLDLMKYHYITLEEFRRYRVVILDICNDRFMS